MGATQAVGRCPAEVFTQPPPRPVEAGDIVDTKRGCVQGFRNTPAGPIHFRGIPIAASVRGANRFKPPQPRAAWSGVHDGTQYAEAVTQKASTGMAALFGPGRSCSDDIGRMGDDCLAIDIISPSLRQQAPLPVMVFVHGGANKQGSPKGDCAASKPSPVYITISTHLNAALNAFNCAYKRWYNAGLTLV